MKNLFKTVLLVGLFIASFSSEAFSQKIYNNTDCAFLVKVEFSDSSCGDSGAATVPVLANSAYSFNLPLGVYITASTGYPRVVGGLGTQPVCGIYSIGVSPCPGNATDTQTCSSGPCTTYTATLAAGDVTIN